MATGAQRLPLMLSKTYEALRAAGRPKIRRARQRKNSPVANPAGRDRLETRRCRGAAGVAGPETSPVDLGGCDQRRRHDDDACQALVTALLGPFQLEGLKCRLSLHRPRANV